MAEVTLTGVEKAYGTTLAVRGVNLTVRDGEFVTLLGPSGCGKTTTLHMVAGLLAPTRGTIAIGGRVVADVARGVFIPPHRRNLGMVFQSYALWPHMTLDRNVRYPLTLRRVRGGEASRRVASALALVGLETFADRYPHELSGGQQQRGALARALVAEPDILLLDEPLSNLDAQLREELRGEIRRVQREIGTTVLFVTHDQTEAMAVSDRLAVMRAGGIEQIDTPHAVYERPATAFVAAFIGAVTLLDAATDGTTARAVAIPTLTLPLSPPTPSVPPAPRFRVAVRPEDFALLSPDGAAVTGVVETRMYLGDHVAYTVRVGPLAVRVIAPKTATAMPGEPVGIAVRHAVALAAEDGSIAPANASGGIRAGNLTPQPPLHLMERGSKPQ